MKLKYIVLTIGLIVLAHLIILFVCFYQPADSKTSNVPEKLESPKTAVKNDSSAAVQPVLSKNVPLSFISFVISYLSR